MSASPDFHYFGSTAFHWATDKTRAEVLTKLARMAGANIVKANTKNLGGLYAWTVRVNVPEESDYDIAGYAPRGVPTEAPAHYRIVNTRGHVVPCEDR